MAHLEPDPGRRAFFANVSRTWPVRLVLAIAVAGLVVLAMRTLWHVQVVVAIAAIFVVGVIGLNAIGALLPWSETTRARMARRQALSDRYPSYRYRTFLWIGLGMLLVPLWRANKQGTFVASDFFVPVGFMAAGLVATLVWRFRHASNNE